MNSKSWMSKYNFVNPGNTVTLGRSIKGSFASEFLEAYEKFVDDFYQGHSALKTLKIEDGFLTNQNFYSSILVDKLLRNLGYRSQRMGDLNDMIKDNKSSVESSSFDLGVLYFGTKKNDPLQVKDFSKALRKKGFEVNDSFSEFDPIFVPLDGLDVVFNKDYRGEIGINLSDSSGVVVSNSFSREGFRKPYFYCFDSNGPVFEKEDFSSKPNIVYKCGEYNNLSRVSFLRGKELNSILDVCFEFDKGKTWIFEK
jgi:hypothetical protein